MKRFALLLGVSSVFVYSTSAWSQEASSDIGLLKTAEATLLEGASKGRAADVLYPLLESNCAQIAAETGSPNVFEVGSREFEMEMKEFLGAMAQDYLDADTRRERREETHDLLEQVSSRSFSEGILEQWLLIGKPRLSNMKKVKNLGAYMPEELISVSSSGPGLSLDLSAVSIGRDAGGPGAGNGVVDTGEWVEFGFALKNETGVPWFSTSAIAKGEHPCVFVPKGREQVLSELIPGESAAVSATVYVASECSVSNPSFEIEVRDTWQTKTEPLVLSVSFQPTDTNSFRLLPQVLDSDAPGSSDGNRSQILKVGRSHEFSVGAAGSTAFSSARMAVGFGSRDRGFFESAEIRDLPLHVKKPGEFSASDDLDLELKEGRDFFDKFVERSEDSPWITMDEGQYSYVWLVVDTVLTRDFDPVQPEESEAEEGDGPEMVESSERIPVDQVVEWVTGYTGLVPRPASPKTDGAIESTDGYEVVFDVKAFKESYGEWGLVEAEPEEPEDPDAGVLVYRYRSFVPIRIEAPDHVLGCTDRDALNYSRKATKDDGSCEQPPFYKRVDVGFASKSLSTVRPTVVGDLGPAEVWAENEASLTGARFRFSAGNRWRAAGFFDYLQISPSSFQELAALSGTHVGLGGEFGRAFNLVSNRIEIEAMARLGVHSTSFSGFVLDGNEFTEAGGGASIGLGAGADLRLIARIVPKVGIYLGAGAQSSGTASVATGVGSTQLLDWDSATGVELGLSVFLD